MIANAMWMTAILCFQPLTDKLVFGQASNIPIPSAFAKELPRIEPQEPRDAIRSIIVKDGYQLELAAAEPLVRDPVAMAFDEQCRMFVVEMCDYSEQDTERLGNIRMLEDLDNDGQYERSTLFAHHLSWPTGVICFDGGVFVAAAPDILYLKDTDGDGQSDIREQVYTGFGRHNVQGLLNSFCWGIDNRIYCQSSSCGGNISSPKSSTPNLKYNVNGRDISFDPKSFDIRLESGGGQHGMSFDDWGRRFACQNSDHLQAFVYQDRYSLTTDNMPMPASRQSIATDGPQATVYRSSPIEPWRLVRTRLRVTNQSPGLIEGGGRPAGYFTSATGVTIYRGDAYPKDMLGMAFVGDVGSNIIHRKKLTENGLSMLGDRIDIESEFIASTDIWFRPVQFANAPDGTLYIADLYREVIEHPRSLPDEIKQHLDLTSGRDRGRIYRVVPPGFQRPAARGLASATTSELIETLGHQNGWHRDTASRLLFERISATANEGPSLLKQIETFASRSDSAVGRLHALGLLAKFGAGQGAAMKALSDSNPRVREFAIQCLEAGEGGYPELDQSIQSLVSDADPRARFQLALSIRSLPVSPAIKREIPALLLLNDQSQDPHMIAACLNAIGKDGIQTLRDVLNQKGQGRGGIANPQNLRPLARVAGKSASIQDLAALVQLIDHLDPDAKALLETKWLHLRIGLIEALQDRFKSPAELRGALSRLPSLDSCRKQLIDRSRQALASSSSSDKMRKESIAFLLWDTDDANISILISLISQRESNDVQESATRALMRFQSDTVARELIKSWPAMSPRLRALASDVLFSRASWIEVLLEEAGQGGIMLNELPTSRIAQLKNTPNTQHRVAKLLPATLGTRQEILDRYREALELEGNRERGKAIFAKSCASCHRVEGVGYELGPNLTTFQFRGPEAILQNIIEPNREVNPQYIQYKVVTNDDRVVTGMIVNESPASVRLIRGENQSETIARNDIGEIKSSQLSMMPEGLESQIDLQGMADLLTYLTKLP